MAGQVSRSQASRSQVLWLSFFVREKTANLRGAACADILKHTSLGQTAHAAERIRATPGSEKRKRPYPPPLEKFRKGNRTPGKAQPFTAWDLEKIGVGYGLCNR